MAEADFFPAVDYIFPTYVPNMFRCLHGTSDFFITLFYDGPQNMSKELANLSRTALSKPVFMGKISHILSVSPPIDYLDLMAWFRSGPRVNVLGEFMRWVAGYREMMHRTYILVKSEGPPKGSILLAEFLATTYPTPVDVVSIIVLQILFLIATLARERIGLNAFNANQIYIYPVAGARSKFTSRSFSLKLQVSHKIFVVGLQNMTARNFLNLYAMTQDCGLLSNRGTVAFERVCNDFNPKRDAFVFLCDLISRLQDVGVRDSILEIMGWRADPTRRRVCLATDLGPLIGLSALIDGALNFADAFNPRAE